MKRLTPHGFWNNLAVECVGGGRRCTSPTPLPSAPPAKACQKAVCGNAVPIETIEMIQQLHSTGITPPCTILRHRIPCCQKEETTVRRVLSILMLGAIISCTSGCMIRNYNPVGTATYLWIPGAGEWPIYDPLLNRDQTEKREGDTEADEDG